MAVRTGEASIRFPDVSVYGREDYSEERDEDKLLGDPRVLFEVLSLDVLERPDRQARRVSGASRVKAVVFIDPENERVRVVDTAQQREAGWLATGGEVVLAALGISLPHAEIFAE